MKKNVVPSQFPWTKAKTPRKPPKERVTKDTPQTPTNIPQAPEPTTSSCSIPDHDYVVEPQTEEDKLTAAQRRIEELEQALRNQKVERFGIHRYSKDNAMVKFFTGFPTYSHFMCFFRSVQPYASTMITWNQRKRRAKQQLTSFNQKLSLIDQFFLFCYKVRVGPLQDDIADRFQVNQATVSRYIITWSNFLYCLLGSQPLWAPRSKVQANLPPCFKGYENVRVILDCTELKVQAPSSLVLNSELYSSYKVTNTWKGLVGIAPCGAITFISSLYAGCISDKHITRVSGILDLLEEGDVVMVDKGFLIEDMLSERGCSLLIPNFLSCKGQFSSTENSENQIIANLRVHVERAIRRVREYHIFDGVLPLSLAGSVNQIWSVCCMLCNFQDPLIKY